MISMILCVLTLNWSQYLSLTSKKNEFSQELSIVESLSVYSENLTRIYDQYLEMNIAN